MIQDQKQVILRKIRSVASNLGEQDNTITVDNLADTIYHEYAIALSDIIGQYPDITLSTDDTQDPHFMSAIEGVKAQLEAKGVDFELELNKILTSVLSRFLDRMDGKVDTTALSRARVAISSPYRG